MFFLRRHRHQRQPTASLLHPHDPPPTHPPHKHHILTDTASSSYLSLNTGAGRTRGGSKEGREGGGLLPRPYKCRASSSSCCCSSSVMDGEKPPPRRSCGSGTSATCGILTRYVCCGWTDEGGRQGRRGGERHARFTGCTLTTPPSTPSPLPRFHFPPSSY